MGDVGSAWYVTHPTIPRDAIVAMINLDMIGRGSATDERAGGPDYLELVGARRLSSGLGDLIERISRDSGYRWHLDSTYDRSGHPEQVYCRSDHASYARFGIPVAFMFTGYHADYHRLTDEPEYIDYAKRAKVARFARDVVEAIGNLDHRPAVDRPAPSPGTPCRQ
jgi:Zn-dependent M28 family amino/carboxypeptidase